mmetsp:Transcript_18275/g.61120  ORF Transcript_18275/g.61120 Transcript_18275/m.61120 type:complete len:686 (-) Transcript_18275:133-2190(-)
MAEAEAHTPGAEEEDEPYLPEDDDTDGELEAQFPMPKFNDTLDNALVVDGLPIVPKDKLEKLQKVLEKLYSQLGTIAEDGIMIPMDENTQMSKGFAFVEYQTKAQADVALAKTNGYKLDKNHTFVVTSFNQVNEYLATPDEAPPIVPPEYQEKEDLIAWLSDDKARDQYVLRWADNTEIFWNEPGAEKLEPEISKRGWTDTYVVWSPRGRYLACFHRLGIILYGGPSWKKLMKYGHEGVKLLDFSPCERFVVTWSPMTEQSKSVIVWNISTGAQLRAFPGPKELNQMSWPIFRWSHDGEYLARLGEDCIHCYESSTMKLIRENKSEKRVSVRVDGVRDFAWCPADNRIAYWVPELGNSPARVTVIEMPSREEIRQKNLFNLHDVRLSWHPQGDFLGVKVDRHTKTKKTIYTTFELFRVRDRNVAIEVLELEPKETRIIAFAWEPKGVRFALISGEGPKYDVRIYTMETTKGTSKVRLVTKLERRAANTLYWSPQGQVLLLAGLDKLGGELEWYNCNEEQTMGQDEHFMCTDVEWDPTGRYVATGVSHWRHQSENGYSLWSSQGKLLGRYLKDKFYQLMWRPRPPSLLTEEEERDVRKNLRDFSKRYEAEDLRIKHADEIARLEERKRMKDDFYALVAAKRDKWRAAQPERVALRNGQQSDTEDDYTTVEEVDEIVISSEEEKVAS